MDPTGDGVSLHPLILAAGSQDWAKVLPWEGAVVKWSHVVGYLRYHDLSGTEWQTHFRFREDRYGNVRAETLAAGPTSAFGGPDYTGEGWANRPTNVEIWHI